MDSESIKQHFRPEEAPLIDQINDWVATAAGQYRPVLTAFLNPRQRYIAQTIANRTDEVKVASEGGWTGAEMQRLLFYPAYYQPTVDDFDLQLLTIDYPTKFATLHHRQIMGTLLGEGLTRESFGDIITDGQRWQVVVTEAMAQFLRQEVHHVGRVKVKWLASELTAALTPVEDWEQVTTTVSSLRLDNVVAASFNYSRNRAKQLIEHGLVRLNWEVMARPDYPIVAHDLLSVRHAGRVRIDVIGGKTRKQKERIRMSVVRA
ncbi:MAG: RNA-binding protein [Limosilactobacillus pontis]|uniref:RNA-binding protein n=1 Tax=Limosilactobacillus pontis TaxID=35787 RepID=A0A2J6NLA7_9LACO|nr:YlmH/Sll1252 family protein [Limosilactobacillus pontis]PMB81976.1 RNA-binding protein [Limosilactobacillus pontis]